MICHAYCIAQLYLHSDFCSLYIYKITHIYDDDDTSATFFQTDSQRKLEEMTDEVQRSCNMYKSSEQKIQELQMSIKQIQSSHSETLHKITVRGVCVYIYYLIRSDPFFVHNPETDIILNGPISNILLVISFPRKENLIYLCRRFYPTCNPLCGSAGMLITQLPHSEDAST